MSITVGFIGAGGRAGSHMRALKEIDDVKITAICDVVEEKANQVAGELGANAYTDYHDMLDQEDLTAIYVVVPTFAHYDAEVLAAQKGVHLFLEKPVAPSMEKAAEILAAIQKAGVLSCVGYQVRYSGVTQQARAFLQGRTVAMAIANRWGGLPGTPWWRVMAQSGGQLVEQTTHQVDLLRYLVGEVEEVQAYYATRVLGDVPELDIPDVYAVNLKFTNGAIGSLSSACLMREGGGGSGIQVLLKDMRVEIGRESIIVNPKDSGEAGPIPETQDIDQVFMNAIRTGDGSAILSDFEDGARSLDISIAANRSAESGKPEKTYFSQQ